MRSLRSLVALLALVLALTWSTPAHADEENEGAEPGTGSSAGSGEAGGSGESGGSGGSEGSGGEAPAGTSVPRVMLTKFGAKPTTVVAGEKVTLSYTLQNMSNVTLVQNLRITLTSDDAGAFLPVSGSASSYVAAIYAGSTTNGSIEMRTLPSLEQRPYALTLRIEYEDAKANPYQATEQVAIPVTQPARVDTSSPQVMPSEVTVGQQAAVTFSVNNLGRNKLFNVQALIGEGQTVAPQKVFIGTIEPGASGVVDMTLQAAKAGSGKVTVEVTFEDANGKVSTLEREIELTVAAEAQAEPPPQYEELAASSGGPLATLIPLIAAVFAAALIVTAIVLVIRRQRRRATQRDSELALLDDEPLIPADEG